MIHSILLFILVFTGFCAKPGYISNSWNQEASKYIGTDEIRARSSSGLKLFEDGGSSGLFVDDAGEVGIGTTSPDTPLHIEGPATNTLLKIGASSGGDALAITPLTASNGVIIGTLTDDLSDYVAMEFRANQTIFQYRTGAGTVAEAMRVDTDGDLVVGATSTSYEIEAATGQVAGAGAYVNTSDKRLKKDVEPVRNACAKVRQLEPVLYNWRTRFIPEDGQILRSVKFYDSVTKTIEVTKLVSIDGERVVTAVPEVITEKVMKKSEFTNNRLREINQPHGQKDIGFLAQDVEPVFPQAVSIDERGKYLLAYSKFIPLQTACIQEQQQELTDLKVQLQSIVARLDLLESQ